MSIPPAHPYHRRAISIIAIVVALPILLGCLVLAIDVGQLGVLPAEVQATADAGALAGAETLRNGAWDEVETRTLAIIQSNQLAQGFDAPGDQTIEIGMWDTAAKTFTAMDPADASSANSVRVVSVRNQAPLFFAVVLGAATTDVSREAVALITPSCNGIWALDSITIPGSVWIDSFDSTEGPYNAGTAYQNGDACSNGDITVSGSADIHGDVLADNVVINGGSANITGIVESSIDTIATPVIDFGDVATDNDNGTMGLTANGLNPLWWGFNHVHLFGNDSLTLAPGTYFFKHLKLRDQAVLTLTGPTMIYIDGNLGLDASSSTVINTTQNPADLTVYVSGSQVKLNGNAEFYGAILAPNATMKLTGNADFYGNVIANTIEFGGNFDFHVDESLDLIDAIRGLPDLVR